MVANSCGFPGLNDFFKSTEGYPVRCFFLASPLTPPFPAMEGSKGISFKEFADVLKRDDCVGIGEGYWTRIVDGDDRILKQAALAIEMGKTIEGHAAGANKLTQYLLTRCDLLPRIDYGRRSARKTATRHLRHDP